MNEMQTEKYSLITSIPRNSSVAAACFYDPSSKPPNDFTAVKLAQTANHPYREYGTSSRPACKRLGVCSDFTAVKSTLLIARGHVLEPATGCSDEEHRTLGQAVFVMTFTMTVVSAQPGPNEHVFRKPNHLKPTQLSDRLKDIQFPGVAKDEMSLDQRRDDAVPTGKETESTAVEQGLWPGASLKPSTPWTILSNLKRSWSCGASGPAVCLFGAWSSQAKIEKPRTAESCRVDFTAVKPSQTLGPLEQKKGCLLPR